jgi:hypothetical protein
VQEDEPATAPQAALAARGSRGPRSLFLSSRSAPDPDPEVAEMEEMLLESSRESLGEEMRSRLRDLLRTPAEPPPPLPHGGGGGLLSLAATPVAACRCAPPFRPAIWNDGGFRQASNNCYNYSTDYRSDTFAQPGRAAGLMYSAFTGPSVLQAAVRDGLIDQPGANNQCPEGGGPDHLVALAIAPGLDFHCYRKGPDGLWTHKIGPAPATNLDNAGLVITDPRTAARGPYTQLVTFMMVQHGRIKLA